MKLQVYRQIYRDLNYHTTSRRNSLHNEFYLYHKIKLFFLYSSDQIISSTQEFASLSTALNTPIAKRRVMKE
jgi:hypothetical protein